MRSLLNTTAMLVALTAITVACGNGNKPRGTVCSSNAECSGTGPCIAYECVALSTCNTDSDCAKGICDKGYCYATECSADKPCPVGYLCHEKGYCVQAPSGNETTDVQTPDASECSVAADCTGKVTVTTCQEAACTNGKCVAAPKPKDTACTHADVCTSKGTCDGSGTCQPGPNTCDCANDADCQGKGIDDQCTKAVCNDQKKCVKVTDPSKLNQPCNDANGCTTGETCNDKGQCVGGSDPCISDPQSVCQQGATCTSTGDTTYSCAYVKKPCDHANACVVGVCGVTTGTCEIDAVRPFHSPCEIKGAKGPTICGALGRCVELLAAKLPKDDAYPQFQSTCWPGGEAKMYALATAQTGGCTAGYGVFELDYDKFTLKNSEKWSNSCNITPICDADMVYALSNDNGMETMRYDASGPKWVHETQGDIADAQLAQFYNDGAFEVRNVRVMRRLGSATYFAGRLVQSSATQLVRCTDQKCDHLDLAPDPPSGQWRTLDMTAATINNQDQVLLLTSDSGLGAGSWRLPLLVDAKFNLSCDGTDPASPCYSPFDFAGDGQTSFVWTGFQGIGGFADATSTAAFLVGESRWAKVIGSSVPFTFPKACALATQETDCESKICENDQGKGGTCKESSRRTAGRLVHWANGAWVEVTSKPSLTEPPGAADLIDYVYSKVTTVQSGKAVVISGFYRACFGNCSVPQTKKEFVRLQTQPFVVTYYPGNDSWSAVTLLGNPVAKRCCYGVECTSSAPVSQDADAPWSPETCPTMLKNSGGFLNPYVPAVSFRRSVDDVTLYLLTNPELSVTCSTKADCVGIGVSRCVGVVPGTFDKGWCAPSNEVEAIYFYSRPE